MDSVKNIEIINENIKKLKKTILVKRVTLGLAATNIGIMGKCLATYWDKINISTKFIGMLAIGSCYVLSCFCCEHIKRDKFTVDELKFEIEKLEGRGY